MTQTNSGNDILLSLDVSLEEAVVNGPEKGIEVSYHRNIKCRTCTHYENSSLLIKHCKTCSNSKVETLRETKTLKTPPPHIDNQGMAIRYTNLGHYSPETGDIGRLIVTLNIAKMDGVEIDGSDIINQLWVTPFQAKVGGKIPIKGITRGMTHITASPQQLTPGRRLHMRGKGGHRGYGKERGTLFFVVNIIS